MSGKPRDLMAALKESFDPRQRRLAVLEAHVAADCPDRDNCWARDIHDEHSPRQEADRDR